jgi:hypothetical protein
LKARTYLRLLIAGWGRRNNTRNVCFLATENFNVSSEYCLFRANIAARGDLFPLE